MYLDVPECTDYNYAGQGRRLFVFIWDAALPQVHSLTDVVVEDGVGSEAVINFPGKKNGRNYWWSSVRDSTEGV